MTDGLRIAHPQDCPLEGNPEVGNLEGNLVYLCICICVFGYQTHGNIVFEVLVRFPFQKYITSWVFLTLEL